MTVDPLSLLISPSFRRAFLDMKPEELQTILVRALNVVVENTGEEVQELGSVHAYNEEEGAYLLEVRVMRCAGRLNTYFLDAED